MNLTDGEKKLLTVLLKNHQENLSNNGCNDLSDEMKSCLSKEEWNKLFEQYHIFNGDHKDYIRGTSIPDFAVVYYLMKKMELV